MAVPEPEEPDGRGGSEGQDDTDATFAEIVAGWRAESTVPHWPEESEPETTDPRGRARPAREVDAADGVEDEHYQPPDPPPFPVLRPRTLGGLAVIALGVLVFLAPRVLGLAQTAGTVLGVLALAGGIGWLLMGLRQGPPRDSGWDDGARL